jgi:hypothetical protein
MHELEVLQQAIGPILSVKLYRMTLDPPLRVPTLPCLDHEAMLHQTVAPHAAAYLQDRTTGELHEVVLIPAQRRVEIDTVSTWGESTTASRERLIRAIHEGLGGWRLTVKGPSWWRGERRVAEACRAQVRLRDVLLGDDFAAIKYDVDRLQTVGTLMEKQSRVASWGVRTVTGPLLAAAGVLSFLLLGGFTAAVGEAGVTVLRYAVVTVLGAVFLYYGLKAVQLTEMSNRVWKRTAEYNLILAERKRMQRQ